MVVKTKVETGTGKTLEDGIQFTSRVLALKDQFKDLKAKKTKVALESQFEDLTEADVQNTLLWTYPQGD